MNHIDMLHIAFLGQIIVLSLLLPFLVVNKIKQTISKHPKDLFPELYPETPEHIIRQSHIYLILCAIIGVLGVALLVRTRHLGLTEFLNWDSQSVIMLYFLLQYAPFVWLSHVSNQFSKKMRLLNKAYIKTASLKPRKVFDYISTWQLLMLSVIWSVFVVVVVFVNMDPFEGFAGLGNLLVPIFVNLFYWFICHRIIQSKKFNPSQDREHYLHTLCQTMVIINALSGVYITWSLTQHLLDLRPYSDVFQSYYLQIIGIVTFTLLTKQAKTPTQMV
ncbi:hypothetical protein [Marinicella rhabdoformis]|uniref:hypothetical protein n=1 Tax=Marinicella rhabdoformis TaxID=2580566 RepID=UPI0012AEB2C1|nr:hypothetical protein [Marinicella rhabdoformis]